MADEYWFKLSAGWHETPWLAALPWHVRACWPLVIEKAKLTGKFGRCPAPNMTRFAASVDAPKECLDALVAAAIGSGALEIDGKCWVLTSWSRHQASESTERVRRFRNATHDDDEAVTPCNVTAVSVTDGNGETDSNVPLSRESQSQIHIPRSDSKKRTPNQVHGGPPMREPASAREESPVEPKPKRISNHSTNGVAIANGSGKKPKPPPGEPLPKELLLGQPDPVEQASQNLTYAVKQARESGRNIETDDAVISAKRKLDDLRAVKK